MKKQKQELENQSADSAKTILGDQKGAVATATPAPKASKSNKPSLIKRLRLNTSFGKLIVFVLFFALIGGIYLVFSSFAATGTNIRAVTMNEKVFFGETTSKKPSRYNGDVHIPNNCIRTSGSNIRGELLTLGFLTVFRNSVNQKDSCAPDMTVNATGSNYPRITTPISAEFRVCIKASDTNLLGTRAKIQPVWFLGTPGPVKEIRFNQLSVPNEASTVCTNWVKENNVNQFLETSIYVSDGVADIHHVSMYWR